MVERKPATKKQAIHCLNRNKVGTKKKKFWLLLPRSQFFSQMSVNGDRDAKSMFFEL